MRDFDELDPTGVGEISLEGFRGYIQRRCSLGSSLEVDKLMPAGHSEGLIDFVSFLDWYGRFMYSEELMVPSAEERAHRGLARKLGIDLPELEKIRRAFYHFDKDGSGELDRQEFTQAVLLLFNIENPADVSTQRLLRYWREVDSDFSGAVSFKEFLVWYVDKFPGGSAFLT